MTMPRLTVVDMGDEATLEKAVECVVAGDVDMLDNHGLFHWQPCVVPCDEPRRS